jgi:four helix bundle protein
MEKIKHFTDLDVWQMSHHLFIEALEDIKKIPNTIGTKIVADQLLRSIGSISANIAEGFNSKTTKKYLSYLDISLNSSAEAENWYYKVRDGNWLDKNIVNQRVETCTIICRMLNAMINSLEKKLK